ncbi:hypothetical protein BG005_006550 [Podila minutissima]|nr:hypothetical protein BG005_006550 [Podila minutissima]
MLRYRPTKTLIYILDKKNQDPCRSGEDRETYDDWDSYEDECDNHDTEVYGDFSFRARIPPLSRARQNYTTRKSVSKSVYAVQSHVAAVYSPYLRPTRKYNLDRVKLSSLPTEVLHLIFSNLDSTTLCHGISLASHQFHSIAKNYIERIGSWTLGRQKDEDELLQKMRLGQVNVLEIQYSTSRLSKNSGRFPPFDRWEGAWERFNRIIIEPIPGNVPFITSEAPSSVDPTEVTSAINRNDGVIPPCLLHRVKKLIIKGWSFWNHRYLSAIMPFMQSIHTLDLWYRGSIPTSAVPLRPILEACRSLDTLIIDGTVTLCNKGPCTNSNNPSSSTSQARRTFQLAHFQTMYTCFTQTAMEEFMSACPRLMTFQATSVRILSALSVPMTVMQQRPPESLPVEPLYRHAALLCPNLVEFSIFSAYHSPGDTFAFHLRLTAKLFPQIKHIQAKTYRDLTTWRPDHQAAQFLARLSRFSDLECGNDSGSVDRLLKHTPGLTHLITPSLSYSRPEADILRDQQGYLKLHQWRLDCAMWQPRYRRSQSATPQERMVLPNGVYSVPLSRRRSRKLEHRVEKRILRREAGELRRMGRRVSWRCLYLQVVDLQVHMYGDQIELFRYLVHACPNVRELTLRLPELRVGQAEMGSKLLCEPVDSGTEGASCKWRSPKAKWYTFEKERSVRTACWTTVEDTLWALGGLSKLEVIGTGSEATTYRFYVKTGTRFMGTAVSGRGHPSCCIVDLELIKTLLPLTAK